MNVSVSMLGLQVDSVDTLCRTLTLRLVALKLKPFLKSTAQVICI